MREVNHEETNAEKLVNEVCSGQNGRCVPIWGATIYHLDDLPFTIGEKIPFNQQTWNKQMAGTKVRDLLPTPKVGSLPAPQ